MGIWFKKQLMEARTEYSVQKENIESALRDMPVERTWIKSRGELYLVNKEKEPNLKYIKRTDKLAQKIAEKEYLTKKLTETNGILENIDALLNAADCNEDTVYENLPAFLRKSVVPIEKSTEDFIATWIREHSSFTNPLPVKNIFVTMKGEHVRSKSEKIIADRFFYENINYVYEPVLSTGNGKYMYPDFIVLNSTTREDFYFEHCGKMDDSGYSSDTVRKLREYNNAGYWYGINFLCTFETSDAPFNEAELIRIIEKFLK